MNIIHRKKIRVLLVLAVAASVLTSTGCRRILKSGAGDDLVEEAVKKSKGQTRAGDDLANEATESKRHIPEVPEFGRGPLGDLESTYRDLKAARAAELLRELESNPLLRISDQRLVKEGDDALATLYQKEGYSKEKEIVVGGTTYYVYSRKDSEPRSKRTRR